MPVQLHQCLRASRDSVCIRDKVLTRHEDSAGKLRLASAFSAKYMTRHEYFGLQMRVASQTSLADQTASGLKHIVLQLTPLCLLTALKYRRITERIVKFRSSRHDFLRGKPKIEIIPPGRLLSLKIGSAVCVTNGLRMCSSYFLNLREDYCAGCEEMPCWQIASG